MMLQALYRLAQREGLVEDPDYEPKPVPWLVRVSKDGKILGIQGTHYVPAEQATRKKPKMVPKRFSVPRQEVRTFGDRAFFLCDKAEYVFGIDAGQDGGKKREPEKVANRASLFLERVRACAEQTGDEGVRAVLTLLENVRAGRETVTLDEGCGPSDLFAFVYDPDIDVLVTEREKVRAYWKEQRSIESGSDDRTWQCLVSGEPCTPTDLFPAIKRVPGGTPSGVSLVSFNATAFESYGWKSNENAPVSRAAAEACATALNRLLDPAYPDPRQPGQTLAKRNLRLSADTVVCFWAAQPSGDALASAFAGLLEAKPDEVAELYRSLWRGKRVDIADPSAFFALTLTGTQGRVIVRDWFESSVAEVARNLAAHFADLDIVRNTPPPKGGELPPQVPMGLLVESLADPGRSRSENVPAPLAAQFVHAALAGQRYPDALLQRALLRYRAELGNEGDAKDGYRTRQWNDARAAIVKAVLNRRNRLNAHWKEVRRDMDPHNENPGYVLGRLMAVLERIQSLAQGDVNATVIDRYFSGASACPKAVFVRLLKNARHHVRKLRDDKERAGAVFLLDRLLDEQASQFDPKRNGFPAHLDLEQQGLFVLGYHQMRRWLWMNREERAAWNKTYSDAPRAYLWGEKSEQTAEIVG